MRVIAGSARGTKLECPAGDAVRPTPELAREALFNVLRDCVPGAAVLDLFAGSGTFGIEALSRGAASCLFLELSPKHIACLKRNLERTHFADRAEVLRQDVLRCNPRLKRLERRFDLVFLGPPFPLLTAPAERGRILDVMSRLAGDGLLSPNAAVVLQHDLPHPIPSRIGALAETDRRRYGRNVFTFYAAEAAGRGDEGRSGDDGKARS
jgi:16S rRNA (guanine(966)-N(2))-methyltransferase RsmD